MEMVPSRQGEGSGGLHELQSESDDAPDRLEMVPDFRLSTLDFRCRERKTLTVPLLIELGMDVSGWLVS